MEIQGHKVDLHHGETTGLTIVAGGILCIVLGWVLHSRVLRVMGFLGAAAGSGLYARARIAERSQKIDAAENHIRSELDDLDPLAKAQVIAKLATEPE
jgi:hypothetical protein